MCQNKSTEIIKNKHDQDERFRYFVLYIKHKRNYYQIVANK